MNLITVKKYYQSEINFMQRLASKILIYPFVGTPKTVTFVFWFLQIVYVLVVIDLFICLCLTGFGSLIEVINITPNIGGTVMAGLRLIKFRAHSIFFEDTFNHLSYNFWNEIVNTEENLRLIKKYTYYIKVVIRVGLYYIAVVSIIINIIFPWAVTKYETDILGKKFVYRLPYNGWYPFSKAEWYYYIYFFESITSASIMLSYAISEYIYLFIIGNVCLELKILGNNLRDLITQDYIDIIQNGRNTLDARNKVKQKLRYIIIRHQYLIKLTSKLSDIIGDVLFLNCTFGALLICLTAFTSTVVDDLHSVLRYFLLFVSLIIAIAIPCCHGQLLIDHSIQIVDSVWYSQWIYADKETKTLLLLFMTRAQHPLSLRALGLIPINLNTFSKISKFVWQLFNLLRTVYNP